MLPPENGDFAGQRIEIVGDAVDQPLVVQLVEGIDERQIVAFEDVAEARAADGFGLGEDVADGIARRCRRIGDEELARHVHFDAVRLVLVGGPVKAETTFEAVESAFAQSDVVAGEALHAVAVGAAVENVVALDQRDLPRGCAVIADHQIAAGIALDPVVAFIAYEFVVVLAAENNVIAETAVDGVDTEAAVQ